MSVDPMPDRHFSAGAAPALPASIAAPDARTLYVSRSAPPGVSGSAHVLQALLAADQQGRLSAVGARPVFSRRSGTDPALQLLRTELNLFGRGARFLAPLRQALLPLLRRRLAALAAAEQIARIVCVFPDALYCQAALEAGLQTGKPVSFYFHNTYADNRSGIAGWHARRLEARIFRDASQLFFISGPLREHFVGKYPEAAARCQVLPHPVPAASLRIEPRGFGALPLRATMMGNINESNLDAAARMLRVLSRHAALRIRLCTPVPRMLLAARGVDLAGIEYLGYLPEERMDELLAETDLFLLPHGLTGAYSEQEYRTIFPTRAAHYLARARPVLAHCPARSGLADFLASHQCALLVTEADEAALTDALQRLLAEPALQLRLAENAAVAARLFDPAAILERLAPTGLAAGNGP